MRGRMEASRIMVLPHYVQSAVLRSKAMLREGYWAETPIPVGSRPRLENSGGGSVPSRVS